MKKITAMLLQPTKNLHLKIHVKLFNELGDGRKENFHKIFTMDNGESIFQLDLQSFITIELKDGNWSKDKTVILDQKNIYQVIASCKKILEGIYDGGIFAINKDKKIIMYSEERDKYTQKIYNIGTHQRMIMQPAVIYDDAEDNEYEGVVLYLNKTDNYVELPIDAFESIYYTLSQVNLFVYSSQLLNIYLNLVNKKVEINQTVVGNKPSKNFKNIDFENKGTTKSTLSKTVTKEEFFNMPNKEDKATT